MGTPKRSKPQMTVGQLLAQVCRMTGHRIREHMESIGMHRGQGFALIHLLHRNGLSQRDLARLMHISPASVTHMLQRMERDGWIERKRDDADQRIIRVYASGKAVKLRRETQRVFREMEDEINAIYTPEEQATLKQLLIKLHDHYAPDDPHSHHLERFLRDEGEDDA